MKPGSVTRETRDERIDDAIKAMGEHLPDGTGFVIMITFGDGTLSTATSHPHLEQRVLEFRLEQLKAQADA